MGFFQSIKRGARRVATTIKHGVQSTYGFVKKHGRSINRGIGAVAGVASDISDFFGQLPGAQQAYFKVGSEIGRGVQMGSGFLEGLYAANDRQSNNGLSNQPVFMV